MQKKIGIPRALSYYCNYPFYKGFFDELEIETIVSDKTTSKLINDGCKKVVSDTCLPVKVFVGHVINLLDKGCDTILVPSLSSTDFKINNCSKIRGLPEIIRNIINRDFKMVEPVLDKTEGIGLNDFCISIAKDFGITDKKAVKKAMQKGFEYYNNFRTMTKAGVDYKTALECAINGKNATPHNDKAYPVSVAIMAHSYNLYDERISLNLIKKLQAMDVKVYTALNTDETEAENSIYKLGEIKYWANETELTGTAAYYMLSHKVDGIIALSAFGCGPDSLMVNEIEYHAREHNMPIIHLTTDEHTGEAGFITRLEAFVDMLVRRKRKSFEKLNKFELKNELNLQRKKYTKTDNIQKEKEKIR